MSQSSSTLSRRPLLAGWAVTAGIIIVYSVLYALNYRIPLEVSNLTSRVWNWSQTALSVTAIVVILLRWKQLTLRPVLIGLALGLVSAISHWQHDPYIFWCGQEGLAVLFCFVAGVLLFKKSSVKVSAFDTSPAMQWKNAGMAVLFALPLAILNNLYFYQSTGTIQFKPLLESALEALSPAIHEEIIFRFFILALVFASFGSAANNRWVTVLAVILAVVPHS